MFPIRDTIPSRTIPFVTWTLIAANVAVFFYQRSLTEDGLQRFIYIFSIVPLRYTDPAFAAEFEFPVGAYWPFITSMFVHGGWLHIIGNLWMLWIFGDNVEDRMGPFRFLVFYLICGAAAGITHTLANSGSPLPMLGASGAVAGVLGAYLFLYPTARVLCLIPIFFYPLFLYVRAFVFILIWIVMQLVNGALALSNGGQGAAIAWWAHIGGFVAGIVLLYPFVKHTPPPIRYQQPDQLPEGWRR